jgi:dihydroxy-acid dehydratase
VGRGDSKGEQETRRLRSNFEPGTTRWAVRRSQWRALGLTDAEMERPKIAIVNSSSQLSVCFSHLDELSRVVQLAVREAGGLPFEIRTVAPSDFITNAGRQGRYLLPSRDLIVNDIEVAVEGALLDGMICLASCDKTAPAHLMAAGRLNVPTVVVIGGYQGYGTCGGEPCDIEDVFESVGGVATGNISLEQLRAMTDVAVDGPGVCSGLGTANTMHIMCEALGMAMPGSAPVRAGSARMSDAARQAGARIVAMVEENLQPREVLTPSAFENAVMVLLAISGSINAVRHLQGVAVEAEVDVKIHELLEKYADEIPLLCQIRPAGPGRVYQLEQHGGARAVMKRLVSKLHTDALSVTGMTVGGVLEELEVVPDDGFVKTVENPAAPGPALAILRGSLAPEGAIVKMGAFSTDEARFSGRARVFGSQEEALAALERGSIHDGDVLVLRGLGPKGGPGVASASWFTAALSGTELSGKVAIVTDGQLSGLNKGLAVGQVMPEAAEGGPLALVQDGDAIVIDFESRSLDLGVSPEELRHRRDEWLPPEPTPERGWLSVYQQVVQPMSMGAVLGPRD